MNQSAALKKAKRTLRRRVLATRDAMGDEARRRAGAIAVDRFLDLPEVRSATTVMAFSSFGSEVDTAPLLERLAREGKTLVLPRIDGDELQPRTWAPGEALDVAWFGAAEPRDGRVVDPATIDVVAVPGVAFDRRGGRVGYGGGFYDRFLPRLRADALLAALGYACQLLEDPVPAGAFDVGLDVIVTDREVLRVPSRATGPT